MLFRRKQIAGLPTIKAVVNDGTNTFNSAGVLQPNGELPANGYVRVTGTATMRLIDVMLRRPDGPFVGRYSSDLGHNFAAGEWSATELRVYNLSPSQTFASGDVRITFVEEQ